VYSNFSKKNWKKMKSPSYMKNGRFHPYKCGDKVQKIGVLYTHSPKMSSPSPNISKKLILFFLNKNNWKKRYQLVVCQTAGRGSCPLDANGCSKLDPSKILLPPTHIFLNMWSQWLHHMPSLPRLLLKFSNTHNF
jgi:hypothetical protein